MIRRGFWLAAGATGGIIAYRRVAAVLPRRGDPRRHWVRETIRFTQDVREGMDLYMVRHPRRVGPTLGASAVDEEKDGR
jgi:hypothetical protein